MIYNVLRVMAMMCCTLCVCAARQMYQQAYNPLFRTWADVHRFGVSAQVWYVIMLALAFGIFTSVLASFIHWGRTDRWIEATLDRELDYRA